MAISLDVVTRLNDRSARTAAQEAQRYFDQASRQAGTNFDRNLSVGFDKSARSADRSATQMQRAFNRAADAAGRVRVEQERYNQVAASGNATQLELVRNSERLASARRNEATAVQQAARAHRDHENSLRSLQDSTNAANTSLTTLGDTFGSLGRVAGPVGIAALVPALGALAGVAAAASGAVALLPGALGAVASAVGTVKLATFGLDDAFKNISDPEKFAESLRALAPNAQQFALSIRNMLPALTQLKNATQDAFFAGIGSQLTNLTNTLLPTVQRATTGIAQGLNQALSGVMSQLSTPQGMQALNSIADNLTRTFQNLAPAAAPFTQALLDIADVGAGALPGIAKAAADAARAFSDFITQARDSGQLEQWLSSGLDIIRQMGPLTLNVAKAFLALAPIGERVMPLIVQSTQLIAELMPPIAEVTAKISPLFLTWEQGIKAATTALGLMMPALKLVAGAVGAVADGLAFLTGDAEGRARADMINARLDAAFQSAPFGGTGQPTLGGAANASRERRGLAPVSATGAPIGLPSGGSNWWDFGTDSAPLNLPPATSASSYVDRLIANGQAAKSGSSGSARNAEGLVPNAANLKQTLQQLFPGITIGGYRPNDPYPDHPSGEALDIMVGNNRLLGDQINRWLLQNAPAFGLQYDLWQQAQWDPSGEVRPMADRGSPTANHRDHVHARVSPGDAANGLYMPVGATAYQPGGVQDVAVQSFGSSAQTDLNGAMSQMGNQLDADLGFSKGLPGLAENAVKFVGNLFFAPLLTALSALAGAAPNEGSGLLGMAAANGALPGFGGGTGLGGPSIGASAGAAPFGISPSAMGPAALQPPGGWSADWNAMAQKESSGNWGIDTGNGYQGGLQFSPSSWAAAGGTQYAPSANLATPFQQAMTAEQLLKMQGPGAWPNTFTPGSSGPGGGGGMLPGLGMPQAAPMGATGGMAYPATAGSGGAGVGGMAMDAAMMGAGALNALAPGAGAAAQIGIQLANRTIKYASQVAGIATSGLLETFSVGDNPLGSLGAGWFGKLAGGVASARPATPNKAGQSAPPRGADDPKAAAQAGLTGGKAARNGNTANITINNNGASPDQNGKDIAAHTAAMWAPAGRQ